MTEDEAFSRLRTLLVQVDAESVVLGQTDEPLTDIIKDHQRAPRPDGPYGRLSPVGSRDTGEGFALCYETVTLNGVQRVVEVRTTGVAYGWRIDVYASRAGDYVRAFHAALRSARAQLELLPFHVTELDEVKETRERVGETWEGRANLSVTLSASRTQRTLIDVIESGHIVIAGSRGGTPPVTTSINYAKD